MIPPHIEGDSMLRKRRKTLQKILSLKQIDETLARICNQKEELKAAHLKEMEQLETMEAQFRLYRSEATQPDGSWLGMRLGEALRRLLKDFGRPMTSRELADAVREKGLPSKSKDLVNTVYVTLHKQMRLDKSKKEGVAFRDEKWELKEWRRSI